MQTVASNSEDTGPDGEAFEIVKYWPAHLKRKRPEWLHWGAIDADNGARLAEALDELYEALDRDLNMLAGIGLRTCFDIAAELLGVDKTKSFAAKLTDLEAKNLISGNDKSRLETLVDAGSASAHRGWKPTFEELNVFMDALEHFVQDAFVNPTRKKRIDAKIAKISSTIPTKDNKAN